MTSKFAHFDTLNVKGDVTKELTLSQIDVGGVSPTLIVGPATEANKPFFNAQLKNSGKNVKQIQAGRVTASMLENNRNEDRELYPKYIIKDWKNMLNSEGQQLKFSTADCIDFIDSIPDWLFDDIRVYCGNPQNFIQSASIDVVATGNA